MQPGLRLQVIRYLFGLPIPGAEKARLYGGWARDVGLRVRGNDIMALKRSGTDGEGMGLDKVG